MSIEPGNGIHACSVVINVEMADDVGRDGFSVGGSHRAAKDKRERADGDGKACGQMHMSVIPRNTL